MPDFATPEARVADLMRDLLEHRIRQDSDISTMAVGIGDLARAAHAQSEANHRLVALTVVSVVLAAATVGLTAAAFVRSG